MLRHQLTLDDISGIWENQYSWFPDDVFSSASTKGGYGLHWHAYAARTLHVYILHGYGVKILYQFHHKKDGQTYVGLRKFLSIVVSA